MTYQETCDYLFNKTANYESQGKSGYKEGLQTMEALDEHFGHPHRQFKTIHIAGTNGKGSCSHTLAALLRVCGYKVGLYTSPHLLDFSERIRVNGQPISHDYVVDFVETERAFFEPLQPTFFELATAMAFKYFSDCHVDIAIVEVGLGGRLDSTNIITPIVSVITNISLDHTQLLGSSLEQIAVEKGGIIKPGVPIVIGEALPETRPVFEVLAAEANASIVFAEDLQEILSAEPATADKQTATDKPSACGWLYQTLHFGSFRGELSGSYQVHNTATVLATIRQLQKLGYLCDCDSERHRQAVHKELEEAFANVSQLTGLKGRWQTVGTKPTVVCDTGHNLGGWQYLSRQLTSVSCRQLHIVFGMVNDKDVYGVMALLPKNAIYYFTKADTKRALPEQSMQMFGQEFQLAGLAYPTVKEAYEAARENAQADDFIFVGGSSYVVADFLRDCV